jgi:hypothetical protein
MKRLLEELNAAEALFGFAGWLTSRKERTIMSASDLASPAADRVGEYIKAQGLSQPRKGWDRLLKVMGKEEKRIPRFDDNEITNRFSGVQDLTMWPGSTYSDNT